MLTFLCLSLCQNSGLHFFFGPYLHVHVCVGTCVCVHLCVHVYVCTIIPGLVFSYLQIVSHVPGMSLLEEGRPVGAYVLLSQKEGAPSY